MDAFLVAPAAAAFLGRLESRHRPDTRWWEIPANVDRTAIANLAEGLPNRPLGELVAVAVAAAESNAGRWSSGPAESVARALRGAPQWRPLAEALVRRLQSVLAGPLETRGAGMVVVAVDGDGVHLTWGGFLTTEGLVIDLGTTMSR